MTAPLHASNPPKLNVPPKPAPPTSATLRFPNQPQQGHTPAGAAPAPASASAAWRRKACSTPGRHTTGSRQLVWRSTVGAAASSSTARLAVPANAATWEKGAVERGECTPGTALGCASACRRSAGSRALREARMHLRPPAFTTCKLLQLTSNPQPRHTPHAVPPTRLPAHPPHTRQSGPESARRAAGRTPARSHCWRRGAALCWRPGGREK